jgi:tRNA pseudouridine38-40 synthase
MPAYRLAYLGFSYHGWQFQKGVRTIEGELLNAFEKLGFSPRISACCRTDKGVSALSQVMVVNTKSLPPRAINSFLDDIWVYASSPQNFDPRRDASMRKYRYFFPDEGQDMERMEAGAKLFLEAKDLSNFTPDKKGMKIDEIKIWKIPNFLVFEFSAKYFAREVVRRIIYALSLLGKGERSRKWIEELLSLERKEGIPPASPYGLILWDVKYPNVEWKNDEYAKRRAGEMIASKFSLHSTMVKIMEEMEKYFKI